MTKTERWKKKTNNFLYDHIHLKNGLDIGKSGFLAILGAILYALAFVAFITPFKSDPTTIDGSSIITGGVGGITQVVTLILNLCNVKVDAYTAQSIGYFVLNIPILIFAYFKIGKRFALLTMLNVGLSSLFIQLFQQWSIVIGIAEALSTERLARVVFAGSCVGLSSAVAYKGDVSCGGIDVISYFFAMRKSTSVGKYAALLNGLIIVAFTFLTIAINKGDKINVAVLNLLYSVLYIFVCSLVVDFINVRNKKTQIQIISENPSISTVLIANFPHSTTTVTGRGGYSHNEKTIVYIVVSSNEVRRVVNTARKVDPSVFITVTSLNQAYGNFFIKPVE